MDEHMKKKHKVTMTLTFDQKVNEREALEAATNAFKGKGNAGSFSRRIPGKRGVYDAGLTTVTVTNVGRTS